MITLSGILHALLRWGAEQRHGPVARQRRPPIAYDEPTIRFTLKLRPTASTHHLDWPVDGRISSGFGERLHPIKHRVLPHAGVDIAAREGSPVWATRAGTVVFAGNKGENGNLIVIDHGGGDQSFYAHLSAILVHVDQQVDAGDHIGAVGHTGLATGSHLHYAVKHNGQAINPGLVG